MLRGLAVIAVVLFHLDLGFARLGYLGVDAFFVISGFLMAMLYTNIASLGETKIFFYRRARRLLPAFWFTLLATAVTTLLICLPHEVETLNNHNIWSYFLIPNIGFWNDAEYWRGSQFRPLLNLWSLGVEFQFYLFYPVISKFCNSQSKRLMLMLISLFGYVLVNQISAKTAFYMMPTRLWQFLLGILAFEVGKKLSIKYSQHLYKAMFILLLVMLALPLKTPPQEVYKVTIPFTFLVFVVILASVNYKVDYRNRLPQRLLIQIGNFSFSIYLMHFPILIFLQYEPFNGGIKQLQTSSKYIVFFLLLILFVTFTYLCLEKYNKSNFRLNILIPYGIFTLVFLCVLKFLSPIIYEQKFNLQTLQISNAWLDQSTNRCGKFFKLLHFREDFCSIGLDNFNENYLLIGNSHADSIKTELSKQLNLNNIGLYLNSSNNSINDIQAKLIVDKAVKLKIKKVIFHSRAGTTNYKALERVLIKLDRLKIQSFYILPVPEYSFSVTKKMYEVKKYKTKFPYINFDDYLVMNRTEIEEVSYLSSIYNLQIMQTPEIFCSPLCKISDSDGLLYFDSDHLTLHGSKVLVPIFNQIIGYPS